VDRVARNHGLQKIVVAYGPSPVKLSFPRAPLCYGPHAIARSGSTPGAEAGGPVGHRSPLPETCPRRDAASHPVIPM